MNAVPSLWPSAASGTLTSRTLLAQASRARTTAPARIYVFTRQSSDGANRFISGRESGPANFLPNVIVRPSTCPSVTGLFIDVGTNYSVLDHTNLSFIYEDVLSPGPNSDGEFVRGVFLSFSFFCAPLCTERKRVVKIISDTRPHRRRSRIAQLYSPGGATVHPV